MNKRFFLKWIGMFGKRGDVLQFVLLAIKEVI